MVLIKRAVKSTVYKYLLQEGVIVVKKDFNKPKHEETGCKNLEVWMLLRSLKDMNHVDLVYNWQYYYYYVKTEGVAYLREALGIVEENVAPITFKNTKKTHLGRAENDEEDERKGR